MTTPDPQTRTLKDYAKHDEGCESSICAQCCLPAPYCRHQQAMGNKAHHVFEPSACDCGLDALLAPAPPQQHEDALLQDLVTAATSGGLTHVDGSRIDLAAPVPEGRCNSWWLTDGGCRSVQCELRAGHDGPCQTLPAVPEGQTIDKKLLGIKPQPGRCNDATHVYICVREQGHAGSHESVSVGGRSQTWWSEGVDHSRDHEFIEGADGTCYACGRPSIDPIHIAQSRERQP